MSEAEHSWDKDVPRRPVRLDHLGRLAEDIPCEKCGYNLRGLPRGSRCPECAEPLPRRVQADLLRFSDPVWVAKLAKGMNWVFWCLCFFVLCVFAMPFAMFGVLFRSPAQYGRIFVGSVMGMYLVTLAAVLIVSAIGIWQLTTIEPGSANPQRRTCLLLRVVMASVVVAFALGFLPGGAWWTRAQTLLFNGIVIGGFVLFMLRVRHLAARIPSPGLQVIAELLIFAIPPLIIVAGANKSVGYEIYSGPAAVLFAVVALGSTVLFDRLRRALRIAAAQAAEHARGEEEQTPG